MVVGVRWRSLNLDPVLGEEFVAKEMSVTDILSNVLAPFISSSVHFPSFNEEGKRKCLLPPIA